MRERNDPAAAALRLVWVYCEIQFGEEGCQEESINFGGWMVVVICGIMVIGRIVGTDVIVRVYFLKMGMGFGGFYIVQW